MPMRTRVGLAVAAAVGLLLALEVGLRIFDGGLPARARPARPDPELGWAGDAVAGDPRSGLPRILVVGDGFSSHATLDGQRTDMYYGVAGRALGAEVFAYGGVGYGTLQEALALVRQLPEARPDLVILQVSSDDFVENSPELERASRVGRNLSVRPYVVDGAVVYRAPVAFGGLTERSRVAGVVVSGARGFGADLARRGWLRTVEGDIRRQGHQHAGFLRAVLTTDLLVARAKQEVWSTRLVAFPADDVHPFIDAWRTIFRRHGIPFADFVPGRLRDIEFAGAQLRLPGRAGWSIAGHAAVGDLLAGWIVEHGYLRGTATPGVEHARVPPPVLDRAGAGATASRASGARRLAVVLPFLALALLLVIVRPRVDTWRMAVLMAAVLWGVAALAATELTSLVGALSFEGVGLAWAVLVAVLARTAWRGPTADPREALRHWSSLSWRGHAAVLATGALVAVTGVVAIVAPPNTYDSMTYHMSRVAHWIQNGNVAHHVTTIERQIHPAPWAEFAIANLQVLAGGDRLANLVQWLAMVGSVLGVSLVARQLGGDRRAQVLAAVAAATIPMGVLQASSTQNDYTVAFWVVCLAAFVLGRSRPALVGAALGLALVTKATAYLFAAPLVLWLVADRVARERRAAWRALAVAAAVALAVNAGYFARNVDTFGAPLGPGAEGPYRYTNGTVGVRQTLSVALRNVGVQLGTPWPPVNRAIEGAVAGAHRLLGLAVDDPATTWLDTRFRVVHASPDENTIPNGVHLVLAAAAVLAVAVRPRPRRVAYALALVGGFLIFSALLRWQPWHSRLELPLFVLAAPLIGLALAPRRTLGPAVAAGLLLSTIGPLCWNDTRPLVGPGSVFRQGREAQYFAAAPELYGSYRTALARAGELRCLRIGLLVGGDFLEYPIWVVGKRMLGERVSFQHGDWSQEPPCVVFSAMTGLSGSEQVAMTGWLYRRDAIAASPITIYVPAAGP